MSKILFAQTLGFNPRIAKEFWSMLKNQTRHGIYFMVLDILIYDMFKPIISWDIYEIKTKSSQITEVMLRGRIRKFCLEKNRNVLIENAQDRENTVRFAVPSREEIADIKEYLKGVLPDVSVEKIEENIKNPVLSKLKVNVEGRYVL